MTFLSVLATFGIHIHRWARLRHNLCTPIVFSPPGSVCKCIWNLCSSWQLPNVARGRHRFLYGRQNFALSWLAPLGHVKLWCTRYTITLQYTVLNGICSETNTFRHQQSNCIACATSASADNPFNSVFAGCLAKVHLPERWHCEECSLLRSSALAQINITSLLMTVVGPNSEHMLNSFCLHYNLVFRHSSIYSRMGHWRLAQVVRYIRQMSFWGLGRPEKGP